MVCAADVEKTGKSDIEEAAGMVAVHLNGLYQQWPRWGNDVLDIVNIMANTDASWHYAHDDHDKKNVVESMQVLFHPAAICYHIAPCTAHRMIYCLDVLSARLVHAVCYNNTVTFVAFLNCDNNCQSSNEFIHRLNHTACMPLSFYGLKADALIAANVFAYNTVQVSVLLFCTVSSSYSQVVSKSVCW